MSRDNFLIISPIVVSLAAFFLKNIEESLNPIKNSQLSLILFFGIFLSFVTIVILFFLFGEIVKNNSKFHNLSRSKRTRKKR